MASDSFSGMDRVGAPTDGIRSDEKCAQSFKLVTYHSRRGESIEKHSATAKIRDSTGGGAFSFIKFSAGPCACLPLSDLSLSLRFDIFQTSFSQPSQLDGSRRRCSSISAARNCRATSHLRAKK